MMTHCHNCHKPLKAKAWRGKDLGLCYACFKKWERAELKEQAKKEADPRYQRLSELIGKLTFFGLTTEERTEHDSLLAELAKEDEGIAMLQSLVTIVKTQGAV